MAVYVDYARNTLVWHYRWMIMCHMLADTIDELHAMADKLDLRRDWFQQSRLGMPHYDLTLTKRRKAVSLGAVEVQRHQVVALVRRFRAQRMNSDVQMHARDQDAVLW